MRQQSPFDVHWLWRLKYTPLRTSQRTAEARTLSNPSRACWPRSALNFLTDCGLKAPTRLRRPAGKHTDPWPRFGRRRTTRRGGGKWERQQRSGNDPDTGGGGTEGQRLIVYMVEVATFRIHCDDYSPADELNLITHGNNALPAGAGGLALQQRATIALLRNGARHHVRRPGLKRAPLCDLSYVGASYATDPDWGLGDPTTYVSKVPTPSPLIALSVSQTMARIEQPEGTLMKYHDGVKRALAIPDHAECGASGCGEGNAVAEKSTWFMVRMPSEKLALTRYGKCGTHSLCPTLVYPPSDSGETADHGRHHYIIGNSRTAPNTHPEMRNFLGPVAITALIVAAFADVDSATWENMVVLSFAAGSGSVEHACSMIGIRCYSFDIRELVTTFGAVPLDLTGEIYGVVSRALRADGRYMRQVSATFADLECTTEGGLQAKNHRIITPGTKLQKETDPAHGKPKPGAEGAKAADLDAQIRNVLTFNKRLQTERDKAHASKLPERSANARAPVPEAEPSPQPHTEPPIKLITTNHYTICDLPIVSLTDPALNRHSTSVNLPMAVAGVSGCRGHD